MRIINQAKMYHLRPSEILNIDDEYTAFCLDEACCFIRLQLEEVDDKGKPKNKPKWMDNIQTEGNNKTVTTTQTNQPQNNQDIIKWFKENGGKENVKK